MPDNPTVVTGSVSRDDEEGPQPGTRDEIALLITTVGFAAMTAGVGYRFGWTYALIVGGGLVFVAGILLGFGGGDEE